MSPSDPSMNVGLDSSYNQGYRSTSRGGSNVREMVATNNGSGQEEVKLFEQKFKGSLDKLDEFEREWSMFKTSQHNTTLNIISPQLGALTQQVSPMGIGGLNTSALKINMSNMGGLKTIFEDDNNPVELEQSRRHIPS